MTDSSIHVSLTVSPDRVHRVEDLTVIARISNDGPTPVPVPPKLLCAGLALELRNMSGGRLVLRPSRSLDDEQAPHEQIAPGQSMTLAYIRPFCGKFPVGAYQVRLVSSQHEVSASAIAFESPWVTFEVDRVH